MPPEILEIASQSTMASPVTPRHRRSISKLIESTRQLAKNSKKLFAQPLDDFTLHGETYSLPRFLFVGPPGGGDYLRIGIFAGVHGDETAGIDASLRFLQELHRTPDIARGYEIFVYPVCNPTGYEDNTRWTRSGKDLNREFWHDSRLPEVRQLEEELRGLHFQGIISLHADDTSDGLYGFARGSALTRYVLQPALQAAAEVLPINAQRIIDNFNAQNGIIHRSCYQGILGAPPEVRPRPFEIVFETPQLADHDKQVEAHLRALKAVLSHYQTLISEAQNI
ncbi:MAG: hypothetical protein B9S32_15705 [Verrucomicrobia bacterium Tous-C9LFEB]|nr:MAG: hypothetical protein B9S32_15705 [Verrucomicrobia bacterium Tous-C9LFEB]